MQLLIILLFLILGLFFIIKSSDTLIDACFLFASFTGISKVVIGATLISTATALPEIVTSIIAITKNLYSLAVGNAIGSMICNIALVLGAGIILLPQKVNLQEFKNKAVLLVFLNLLLFFMCLNFRLQILESFLLLLFFFLFLYENTKSAKKSIQQNKKNKMDKKKVTCLSF